MKITSLHLKNFKRFTDLKIEGIPETAKLVLLIGSNGSGKSSVFDAFEAVNSGARMQQLLDLDYYKKNKPADFEIDLKSDSSEIFHITSKGWNIPLNHHLFFGRTSFRQVPRLSRTTLGQGGKVNLETDSDRPRFFIEKDNRFENDIEKISERILKEIFRDKVSAEQIKRSYIEPINNAFENIFGSINGTKLILIEIIPPLDRNIAQINFRKGESEIHYNFLSAGEKEVVNILFNLLVCRDQYSDSIYFLDEIDLHLNTKLQFSLLKEITENWIPADCQLWTASHSLGFIEYAKQYQDGVIIDFDDLDFDYPQTLYPKAKELLNVYDIAIPQEILFEILKGKRIVLCENQNDKYYNLLSLPDTIFVGVKDARDIFIKAKNDNKYKAIRDRDFLSNTEIERIQTTYRNLRILRYYDFENYLYHPDNIAELGIQGLDISVYRADIVKQKNERIHYILSSLVSSRQSYEEFKTDEKLRDKDTDSIVDDFKSDDLERFYKYFDMKMQYNKAFLTPFNLAREKLVKTNWFKEKIQSILV